MGQPPKGLITSKVGVTFGGSKPVTPPAQAQKKLPAGTGSYEYEILTSAAAVVIWVLWTLDHLTLAQASIYTLCLVPLFVIEMALNAADRLRAVKGEAGIAEKTATARAHQLTDALALRTKERDGLAVELAAARIQLEQVNAALSVQWNKASSAEARALALSLVEKEVLQLREENAAHTALTADRRAWRTLPQGHDIESEAFAAAVASALK